MAELLQFYYDAALSKPADMSDPTRFAFGSRDDLRPGQITRETVYASFKAPRPWQKLRIVSLSMPFGDAQIVSQIPEGPLDPGDSFPIVVEFRGREQRPEDLIPLSAYMEWNVVLIADARRYDAYLRGEAKGSV